MPHHMRGQVHIVSDQMIEIDLRELTQSLCISVFQQLKQSMGNGVPNSPVKGEWLLADRQICYLLETGASNFADLQWLAQSIERELHGFTKAGQPEKTTTHILTVQWGGEFGPDLNPIAKQIGLSCAELVSQIESLKLTVAFNGFLPGFSYLLGLPSGMHIPRRDSPRTAVPAGSLAMAGAYMSVYPVKGPGGWHLLGRCDTSLFDVTRESPCLLQPGDSVRFIGVSQ